jgi:hypothetical protein
MSFTVKLAMFPPWKAPVPYETVASAYASISDAAEAGAKALAPITERELADLATRLQPKSERSGEAWVTSIDVPEEATHGYLIYDETGVEVSNWTTLDVALAGAAKG